DHFGGELQCCAGRAKLLNEKDIGDKHAAGNPTQQACAKGNHYREAVDQLEYQRAAPYDDGHADAQTENHVIQLVIGMGVLGRPGNGNDVVQTHSKVSDDDRLHCRHDGGPARDIAMFVFLGRQQFNADPDQQNAAHHFQEGDVQQDQRKGNQQYAQDDGASSSPQYALHSLPVRQVPAGQGNDHSVVAP